MAKKLRVKIPNLRNLDVYKASDQQIIEEAFMKQMNARQRKKWKLIEKGTYSGGGASVQKLQVKVASLQTEVIRLNKALARERARRQALEEVVRNLHAFGDTRTKEEIEKKAPMVVKDRIKMGKKLETLMNIVEMAQAQKEKTGVSKTSTSISDKLENAIESYKKNYDQRTLENIILTATEQFKAQNPNFTAEDFNLLLTQGTALDKQQYADTLAFADYKNQFHSKLEMYLTTDGKAMFEDLGYIESDNQLTSSAISSGWTASRFNGAMEFQRGNASFIKSGITPVGTKDYLVNEYGFTSFRNTQAKRK